MDGGFSLRALTGRNSAVSIVYPSTGTFLLRKHTFHLKTSHFCKLSLTPCFWYICSTAQMWSKWLQNEGEWTRLSSMYGWQTTSQRPLRQYSTPLWNWWWTEAKEYIVPLVPVPSCYEGCEWSIMVQESLVIGFALIKDRRPKAAHVGCLACPGSWELVDCLGQMFRLALCNHSTV